MRKRPGRDTGALRARSRSGERRGEACAEESGSTRLPWGPPGGRERHVDVTGAAGVGRGDGRTWRWGSLVDGAGDVAGWRDPCGAARAGGRAGCRGGASPRARGRGSAQGARPRRPTLRGDGHRTACSRGAAPSRRSGPGGYGRAARERRPPGGRLVGAAPSGHSRRGRAAREWRRPIGRAVQEPAVSWAGPARTGDFPGTPLAGAAPAGRASRGSGTFKASISPERRLLEGVSPGRHRRCGSSTGRLGRAVALGGGAVQARARRRDARTADTARTIAARPPAPPTPAGRLRRRPEADAPAGAATNPAGFRSGR